VRSALAAVVAIGALAHPFEQRRLRALRCCLDALQVLQAERDALRAEHWRRLREFARRDDRVGRRAPALAGRAQCLPTLISALVRLGGALRHLFARKRKSR
jgi:hypothetical protein